MKRIERKFRELRERGEKALIVYLTAGDPTLEKTEEIILGLAEAGMDLLELGVPFSDPTADGPIIQAASQRALRSGVTLSEILQVVASVERASEIPVVLFSYYNPLLAYGCERFATEAKEGGLDGVLVVDLPLEESDELRHHTDPLGIDFISVIAPTTSDERIRRISSRARGFLYCISITGVTGTASPRPEEIRRDMERLRRITRLPLAVGFGISAPHQARELSPYADGVVIGSAMVKMIDENRHRTDLIRIVCDYAKDMKRSMT
jgi:tryptophan synthase alpha chain